MVRLICDNEMQAAAEAGAAYGVPLELADQTIEDTGRRASQLLALTLAQLATPSAAAPASLWRPRNVDVAAAPRRRRSDGPLTRIGLPYIFQAVTRTKTIQNLTKTPCEFHVKQWYM